ncbi:hypothetical protein Q7P37_011622 [Cladosporium fusiforme]
MPAQSSATPTYFQQTMSPAIAITPKPTPTTTAPIIRKHTFPLPLLRLEIRDLAHEGASIFLSHIHGHEDLSTQVQNVLNLLYDRSGKPRNTDTHPSPTDSSTPAPNSEETTTTTAAAPPRPGTRSITLIIRPFAGVAYTTGLGLDDDHKEIHLSASYIVSCARNSSKRDELLGVLCHELVHCFQWNGAGTCPGGLIEGIADWVRLRAGLGAAHWTRDARGEWDAGYQTTGFFLEWLEGRFGEGLVRRLNSCLGRGTYDEERVWAECCGGRKVGDLWREYGEELRKGGCGEEGGPANPIPTHSVSRE